ncbi:unnamed protein product [Closterium sp. Yama58-4]|nr:unnamed protein product [Closterium sp. Yama58-4]
MAHLTHFTLQVHAEHAYSPSSVGSAPSFMPASPSLLTLSQFLAAPLDRAVFLTAARQPPDAASPSSSEFLIRDHAAPRTATSAEPSATTPFGPGDSFRVAGEVVGCVRGNYGGTHFILASCTPRSTATRDGNTCTEPRGTAASDSEMQRSSSYDDVTRHRSQRVAGNERGRSRLAGRGGESEGSASGEENSPPRGGSKKADAPGKGGKAGIDSKSGTPGVSLAGGAASRAAGGAVIDGDARASENADAAPRHVASPRAAFAPLLIGWLPAKGGKGGGSGGDDGARGWGGTGGGGTRGIGGLGAAGGWLTWNARRGSGNARAKGDDERTGDEQSESQEEATQGGASHQEESQREDSQRAESQREESQDEGAARLTEKGKPQGVFGVSWAQVRPRPLYTQTRFSVFHVAVWKQARVTPYPPVAPRPQVANLAARGSAGAHAGGDNNEEESGDYKGSESRDAVAGANMSNALWRVFKGAQGISEECANSEVAVESTEKRSSNEAEPEKATLHGGGALQGSGAQLWGSARWTARGRGGGADSLLAPAFLRAMKGVGARGSGASGGGGVGGGVIGSWGRAGGDRRSGWAWVDAWGVGERGAGADEGPRSRGTGKADREGGDGGARREAEEKGESGGLGWRKGAGAGEGGIEEGGEGRVGRSEDVEEQGGQRVGIVGEGGSEGEGENAKEAGQGGERKEEGAGGMGKEIKEQSGGAGAMSAEEGDDRCLHTERLHGADSADALTLQRTQHAPVVLDLVAVMVARC